MSKYCDGHCKTFLPPDVSSQNHPSMATWPTLKIESTRKIGKHVLSLFKTCAFRYQISQNMCFDIALCTGSGRRTPALQIAKSLYGVVAPPMESETGQFSGKRTNLHGYRNKKRCLVPGIQGWKCPGSASKSLKFILIDPKKLTSPVQSPLVTLRVSRLLRLNSPYI